MFKTFYTSKVVCITLKNLHVTQPSDSQSYNDANLTSLLLLEIN